ncbi:MAG: PaaI family thioesterase [Pseudomonadota bacterium]
MSSTDGARAPVLSAEEVSAFLAEVFPQVSPKMTVEAVATRYARIRLPIADEHLRPGGTVSGPTLFAAADLAFYVAVLGMIGREALTVTTHLGINFMRKPEPRDVIAEARILKLGRSLAVGDAAVFSDGIAEPVAHASVTYAIPPKRV